MQLPLAIVGGVGLWFSISRRKQHPRVSSWAAAGFVLHLVFVIVEAWNRIAMFSVSRTEATEAAAAVFVRLSLVSYGSYLLLIAGIACLARAVFVGRDDGVAQRGVDR